LTIAATLVAISNDGERVRVARLLYHRELNAEEVSIVRDMRGRFDSPPVLPPAAEQAILQATTPDELRQVISTINLRPCGGSFDFRVDGASLVCANGQKVPTLKATGVGSALQSRAALIFHATEGGATEGALRFFSSADARGSVHLLVAHSGAVVQLVPLDRQAWHTGRSEWKEKGIQNLNAHSIGITLSNAGRLTKNPDGTFSGFGVKSIPADRVTTITSGNNEAYWETFTDEQIKASQGIVRAFRSQYPNIGVLGHSDITPGKIDPGPAFQVAPGSGSPGVEGAPCAKACDSHKVYYGISIYTIRSDIYGDLLANQAIPAALQASVGCKQS
jgi:N-acetylmuramoyl-L-alanine amidase